MSDFASSKRYIKVVSIISSVMTMFFAYILFISRENYEFYQLLITYIVFWVFSFSILYFLVISAVTIEHLSAKYKAVSSFIAVLLLSLLIYFGSNYIIILAISIIPDSSNLSNGEKVEVFVSFLSLLIAVIMPLVLLEMNRRENRNIIRLNDEANKNILEQNRLFAIELYERQRVNDLKPILKITENGSLHHEKNSLWNFKHDKQVNKKVSIYITLENITPNIVKRVSISIYSDELKSFEPVFGHLKNPLTHKEKNLLNLMLQSTSKCFFAKMSLRES